LSLLNKDLSKVAIYENIELTNSYKSFESIKSADECWNKCFKEKDVCTASSFAGNMSKNTFNCHLYHCKFGIKITQGWISKSFLFSSSQITTSKIALNRGIYFIIYKQTNNNNIIFF